MPFSESPTEIRAASPLLEVEHLSVTYPNGFQALRDVSLRMDAGSTVGLVGASGSGKSTLVRALLGLLPTGSRAEGRATVTGVDMLALPEPLRRRVRGLLVGYVAQDPFAACDPLHSVGHHIEASWRVHRMRPPARAAAEQLQEVGIADGASRARERPWVFSGGMLQRASIAAGSVHRPRLVLADEPTSALDADLAQGVLKLIDRRSSGLLLVTHDLSLVAGHCRRVVVLADGRVVEQGPVGELLSHPATEELRRLVAASPHEGMRTPRPRRPGRVLVRARSLEHGYDRELLGGFDLDVHAGQLIGVQGPSGCGKSTLLRLLAGLESPRGGTVEFIEASGRALSARPRGFVMPVFQDPVGSLSPRWPLWRCLCEPLRARGERRRSDDWRQWAHEKLEAVGLGDLDVERRPRELSVGQAQRVAIARALAAEPAVIVADEPSASLDVLSAGRVYSMLSRAADEGAGVVVVSHDGARLASVADRMVRCLDGRFRAD